MRLLLVEDDAMIGEALRAGLKREGFAVDWVHDAEAAGAVLDTEPFELMLLDLGLPGRDGLSLLKALRERGLTLPVLILTARDAVSDRVAGLDAGADVALSPREFALLQLLLERPGTILSRAQLEERLYGWGEEVESNAVEVHIHGLRRKLGAQFILTVRGVGYRVKPA